MSAQLTAHIIDTCKRIERPREICEFYARASLSLDRRLVEASRWQLIRSWSVSGRKSTIIL